jgi:glycosyltransferase involved in cell wall biosynthesis
MKKISIITVCYNSEKTIRDTIESVLSQDHPDIEYIVIDGLSDDNTINIVNEYSEKITKIISELDEGIYDAMNKGVKCSTGDIVGILNSDDFFENSFVISDVVNHFNSNPTASLVIGDVVFVEPSNTEKITRFYSSAKFKRWKLRFGWMPPHAATFIKKAVYEKVGIYNVNYKISADYELFVRMLMVHKLDYSRINKVLVRMRSGGISTSGIKSSFLLNTEIVKACKSNGIFTNLFLVLLKIPFKILEIFRKPSISKT